MEISQIQSGSWQKFENAIKEEKISNAYIIYGPSGSGKTTLLNILLNLLKPQKGTYTIDKHSVPKLNDWSNKISFVPQEVPIIEDTLSKNIALGVEEKNIKDKALCFKVDANQSVIKIRCEQ